VELQRARRLGMAAGTTKGAAFVRIPSCAYCAGYAVRAAVRDDAVILFSTRCRGSVRYRVLDASVADAIECPVQAALGQLQRGQGGASR